MFRAAKDAKLDIESVYRKNEAVLRVSRGKRIMQEKKKFDLLAYLMHYYSLEDL